MGHMVQYARTEVALEAMDASMSDTNQTNET
jgi:hypothetical protein